jgi:TonB-linked SusC/RagA family outer membrane protein
MNKNLFLTIYSSLNQQLLMKNYLLKGDFRSPHHLLFSHVKKILAIFSLAAVFSFSAHAQKTITGRVSSGDTALTAVTVELKNSNIGTETDANGRYTISAPANGTLVFSHVGYESQEIPVRDRSTIDVQLKPQASQMNEVVVVGYGTQKKADVTGSIATVPKNRLSELPVTNVLQAVEGAVAGVTVTNTSSVPGSTPAVLIRGQNSLTAASGPYIVVDGIPLSKTGGSINDINPNDIASVDILKDASAVAIYGVNGANGVILITTKRGTTGKPVIRYNGYAGTENLAHILQPRNAQEYVEKYAEYLKQTNQPQTSPVPNASELANYTAGKTTDWIKETTQTGIMQDHNLSVSGGAKDVKYFISGEYMHQKGVIKGYQYHRASLRSNLDINVTKFLTVGTSLFFVNNNYDGGRANLLLATAMSPYGQEYDANRNYSIYPMLPELLYTNPLLGLYTDQVNRSTNLNGNGYAEVNFGGVLKGLKYRLNAGYTYLPTRTGSYTGRDANSTIGSASTHSSETNSYTIDNLLTYTKDWNEHHIDFTGLYSAEERKYASMDAGASGFINDLLSFNNLGAGATQTAGSYADQYRLNSQMGRLNYSYASRYLFTFTVRRDGSSVFGGNTSKHATFPSVALGWNLSNESFMSKVKFIDNLKIRGSYGKSGNEGIPVYKTITTDNVVLYPFEGLSTIGVLAGNLGNADLHWETTKGSNIGLDFTILNRRISGTIDAYKTTTSGLLLQRNLPIITGYSSILDNLGETSNKGIEITVNTSNIVTKNFTWESTINYSANKNKILDIYGDKKSDLGNRWFIGQPIGVIYDYKLEGIWQTGEDASKQDPTAKPGDLKFADINGDGKISADSDKVILGQTTPKWIGGFTNTFAYKNWHLNIFIQTVQGVMKNDPDLNYVDETGRRNTPVDVGYWTPENKSNTRPALSYFNTRGYGYPSNASYTRLKDVTLSYTMSQKLVEALKLGGLTVYASGRNLYTWTKWIGWDPENNYSGRGSGDWTNNYPETRSFILGINVSLR